MSCGGDEKEHTLGPDVISGLGLCCLQIISPLLS